MDAQPNPSVWPECPTCDIPWVLRRCLTLDGMAWLWQRDCKHRTTKPELVNFDVVDSVSPSP